jgi:hypothetical protein
MMQEYIELVNQMTNSRLYPDELRQMDSERMVLHEQILQHLGLERGDIPDMYQYCKEQLRKKRRWF